MRPKYKVTGCARFFIFFLILIPTVYFGAAYIRGEDGMQKLKDFFNDITGKKEIPASRKADPDEYRIDDLKEELRAAKAEIRELKNIIKEKEKEIEQLKKSGIE